jgi:hypothetical protein
MSEASDLSSEEERCLFRPFTRQSLEIIETRIAEEYVKQKELEKKRAEGEVYSTCHFSRLHSSLHMSRFRFTSNDTSPSPLGTVEGELSDCST